MAPNDPCKNCDDEHAGCLIKCVINREAFISTADEKYFSCPEYKRQEYQGLEGCYA